MAKTRNVDNRTIVRRMWRESTVRISPATQPLHGCDIYPWRQRIVLTTSKTWQLARRTTISEMAHITSLHPSFHCSSSSCSCSNKCLLPGRQRRVSTCQPVGSRRALVSPDDVLRAQPIQRHPEARQVHPAASCRTVYSTVPDTVWQWEIIGAQSDTDSPSCVSIIHATPHRLMQDDCNKYVTTCWF